MQGLRICICRHGGLPIMFLKHTLQQLNNVSYYNCHGLTVCPSLIFQWRCNYTMFYLLFYRHYMYRFCTYSAIDPHCLQKACRYIDPSTGRYITPEWRDAPTGETYKPSYNIGPTIFTYV